LLLDQRYKPKKNDLLFHYCSTESFRAILESGKLRFGDPNMMNDREEMRWAYQVFELAANELLREKPDDPRWGDLNKEFFGRVDDHIGPSQLIMHPTIAAFSRQADLLSQWVRYADDGRGVCIAFRGRAIEDMAATTVRALYNEAKQLKGMKDQLKAIYIREQLRKSNELGEDEESFTFDCMMLSAFFPAFKHPSFAEEKEVRAVHMLDVKLDDGLLTYVDGGGNSRFGPIPPEPVRFRVSPDGGIILHVDLPIDPYAKGSAIAAVIIGPRSPNGWGNVAALLSHYGYRDVKVFNSASTYR
jgi:hypothetical protein